jgi:hypothetical protein
MKVFWSWQSDTAQANNHYLVRDALKQALNEVADDLAFDEAQRPELDHDTLNVPGLAAITETIFDKIDSAAVFVADLTYVGKSHGGTKMLPNPNVLIELGYAMKSLGPEHIILVANSAYGTGPENLPFDLRHRRAPIAYNLPENASKADRAREQLSLTQKLKPALAGCLGIAIAKGAKELVFPGHPARPGDSSIWLPADAAIEHLGEFGKKYKWEVKDVPRFYMRFRPARKGNSLNPVQVKELFPFYAPNPWRNGYGGVNLEGVVAVGCVGGDNELTGAAQWFKDTGELWAFSNRVTFERNGALLLGWGDLIRDWKRYLDSTLEFLGHAGVTGPILIEAGATGLTDVQWPDDYGRYSGLADAAHFSYTSSTWTADERYQLIADALSAIAATYGRPSVAVEYVRRNS